MWPRAACQRLTPKAISGHVAQTSCWGLAGCQEGGVQAGEGRTKPRPGPGHGGEVGERESRQEHAAWPLDASVSPSVK